MERFRRNLSRTTWRRFRKEYIHARFQSHRFPHITADGARYLNTGERSAECSVNTCSGGALTPRTAGSSYSLFIRKIKRILERRRER